MSERNFVVVGDNQKLGEMKFHNATRMAKEGFNGVLCEGIFEEFVEEERTSSKGKKFVAKMYKVKDEGGNLHVIDSFGLLDYKMKSVNPGDYIRVSYLGKDANDYHQCQVEVAE